MSEQTTRELIARLEARNRFGDTDVNSAAAELTKALDENERLRKERDEAIDDFHVSHGFTWQDECDRLRGVIAELSNAYWQTPGISRYWDVAVWLKTHCDAELAKAVQW